MPETVIITGASKGIGKYTAKLFALKGYNVLINYRNSEQEAFCLYRRLKNRRLSVHLYKADVTVRKEIDSMVDFCISMFGGVDILVNNAGISQIKLFTDTSETDWNEIININLKGVFNCTQSVLKKYMLENKKGKIINISSIWGMVGSSCEVLYSTSKSGLIGFTKALAKELGPSNIQVNCVAPGIIKTDMLLSYTQDELNSLQFRTPLMKLGKSKDISHCILFLASKKADFITGQVISPNGGFVI